MDKDPFAPLKFRVIHDAKTNRTFKIPIFAPAPKPAPKRRGNRYV